MADAVVLGAEYTHPDKPGTYRMESASVPELDDHVGLVRTDQYLKRGFIDSSWRGTWAEFLEQWERA